MKTLIRMAGLGAIVLGLAGCGSGDDYQGGGRGAPGSSGGSAEANDDSTRSEVPPDPAFDDETEDPIDDAPEP